MQLENQRFLKFICMQFFPGNPDILLMSDRWVSDIRQAPGWRSGCARARRGRRWWILCSGDSGGWSRRGRHFGQAICLRECRRIRGWAACGWKGRKGPGQDRSGARWCRARLGRDCRCRVPADVCKSDSRRCRRDTSLPDRPHLPGEVLPGQSFFPEDAWNRREGHRRGCRVRFVN